MTWRLPSNITSDPHAKKCFEDAWAKEQKLAGDWAVFYHSYNHGAALIYEVQAALAEVLFRFDASYSSLPRILRGSFASIPDAKTLFEQLPSWEKRDHDDRFKACGICASTSLIGTDPEATPTNVFLRGYSVGPPAKSLVVGLIASCGVSTEEATKLIDDIEKLAVKHGLKGMPGASSGNPGHLLQIFIKRNIVDKYAYASLPYGIPDMPRHPLEKHLLTSGLPDQGHIKGQVRIVMNPQAFLQKMKTRLYLYSADPEFHKNRKEFQKEAQKLLAPILGTKEARKKCAEHIFGEGSVPSWWKPEDQSKFLGKPRR